MRPIYRLIVLLASPALLTQTVFAQSQTADKTLPDFSTYKPTAIATRISGEKPVIDGDLSDPIWQTAKIITDFYEVDPVDGGHPSEKTTAYILYDDDNLYFGIYAYDKAPEDIKASQMRRDPRLGNDDNLRIALDPLNTQRDGYLFGVSPTGARLDGLLENNSNFKGEWNTLWQAKTKIVEDGWVAEIAIPFRSLSYDAAADSWGFQIIRGLRHKNERIHWSNIDQSKRGADFTQVGSLTGIDVESKGRGIEAQLFATALASRDWDAGDDTITFEPSANIYYRFTPALTGTLTLNTDFSDTPLDSRQVNTGRFSLFFPETRDFFLQDASVFEFGGQVFERQNGLPFFSRRIGIVDGAPTDIVVGGKLSGKIGNTSIGALVTQTAETEIIDDDGTTIYDGQTLAALRASIPVLDESKIGLVLTNGDPKGEVENTVGGVDFQYRNSKLHDGVIMGADFVALQSTSGDENGKLFGSTLRWESQKWESYLRYKQIDAGYTPRLGFANRRNIRETSGYIAKGFRPKDHLLRQWWLGVFGGQTSQLEDALIDQDDLTGAVTEAGTTLDTFVGVYAFGRTTNNERFFVEAEKDYSFIDEDFDLAGEVLVTAGEYHSTAIRGRFSTNGSRVWSGGIFADRNNIFDGNSYTVSPEVSWRPNKHFALGLDYTYRYFDLPNGELNIHVGTLETEYNVTPDMNFEAEVQYDNLSEAMSIFSRYRWEMKPGRTLTVALSHGADVAADRFPQDFVSTGTSFSIRFGETLRF